MLRELLQRSGWSLALRLTNVALAFGVASVLARTFSPPDLGVYFLLMSAATLLSIVGQWGAGTLGLAAVASALAHQQDTLARERASDAVGHAVRGGMLVLSACFTASALLSFPLGMPAAITTAACGVVACSLCVQGTGSDVLRGFQRAIPSTLLAGVLPNALLLPALVIAGRSGGTVSLLYGLAMITTCYAVCALAVVGVFARDRIRIALRPAALPGSRQNKILVVNSLAAMVYSNVDLWIAGFVLSFQDAALYGVASRLALVLLLPVEAMETATAPVLSRLGLGGHHALPSIIVRTTQLQAVAVAAGVLLVWLTGDFLLSIAFGSRYEGASAVLLMLALGLGVRAAAGPNGYMLLLTGQAGALLKCNLLAVALFVPLQIAGAYWGGLAGLAASAALGTGATSFALAWIVRRRTGFNLAAWALHHSAARADVRAS